MSEEIRYQINGQLADNTVTVDNKEDMILVPVSNGSADEERIIAEMKAEDSGLREETIRHVFDLEKRVIKRWLILCLGQFSWCHRELCLESGKELYRGKLQRGCRPSRSHQKYGGEHYRCKGQCHVHCRRSGYIHPCAGFQCHSRTCFHPEGCNAESDRY